MLLATPCKAFGIFLCLITFRVFRLCLWVETFLDLLAWDSEVFIFVVDIIIVWWGGWKNNVDGRLLLKVEGLGQGLRRIWPFKAYTLWEIQIPSSLWSAFEPGKIPDFWPRQRWQGRQSTMWFESRFKPGSTGNSTSSCVTWAKYIMMFCVTLWLDDMFVTLELILGRQDPTQVLTQHTQALARAWVCRWSDVPSNCKPGRNFDTPKYLPVISRLG